MNERIQELMTQSMVEYQFQNRFSPEKFAELIVRECANAADMAHEANCKYPGDYVVEQMGFGLVEGATAFRS